MFSVFGLSFLPPVSCRINSWLPFWGTFWKPDDAQESKVFEMSYFMMLFLTVVMYTMSVNFYSSELFCLTYS